MLMEAGTGSRMIGGTVLVLPSAIVTGVVFVPMASRSLPASSSVIVKVTLPAGEPMGTVHARLLSGSVMQSAASWGVLTTVCESVLTAATLSCVAAVEMKAGLRLMADAVRAGIVNVSVAVACGAIVVVAGELEAGNGACEPDPPQAQREQAKTTAAKAPLICLRFRRARLRFPRRNGKCEAARSDPGAPRLRPYGLRSG
jgi:hypothetical protein